MLNVIDRHGLRRRCMRRATLAFGVVIVAGVLDAGAPARADGAWCASVTGPEGGYVSCNYSSWQQCQATLSGLGGICHTNPSLRAPVRVERPARRHGT